MLYTTFEFVRNIKQLHLQFIVEFLVPIPWNWEVCLRKLFSLFLSFFSSIFQLSVLHLHFSSALLLSELRSLLCGENLVFLISSMMATDQQ